MHVQPKKSLKGKIPLAVACFLAIGVLLFVATKSPERFHVKSRLEKKGVSFVNKPTAAPAPEQKLSGDKVTPKDYYDLLPPLQTVIAEFKSLKSTEIDAMINEVEEDMAAQELIEKANAKSLDEAGYRELARLMQLSDALYNVKIERQLSALESDLGVRKRGA